MLLENSTLSQGFLFPSKPQHWSPSVFLWLLKHPSKLKNKAQNHLNCLAKGLERSTTFCSEDNFRKQKRSLKWAKSHKLKNKRKTRLAVYCQQEFTRERSSDSKIVTFPFCQWWQKAMGCSRKKTGLFVARTAFSLVSNADNWQQKLWEGHIYVVTQEAFSRV